MISFDEDECRNLEASQRREWLETNGLGGYASASLACENTRRYHGLLVAAAPPPTRRVVLLSKLEEVLIVEGSRFELSTNRYDPDVVSPQGYKLQTGFRLDPFPVFTFRAGAFEIEKRVVMAHGRNATAVRYTFRAPKDARATFEIKPLVAFRDYHSLAHATQENFLDPETGQGALRVRRRDFDLALHLAHDARAVAPQGVWYRNFLYVEERARGFDYEEDLFNPCLLTFDAADGATCNIVASTEAGDARDAVAIESSERERRSKLVAVLTSVDEEAADRESGGGSPDVERRDYLASLVRAADQFVVRRGENLSTVIAGYHWFTDWGRDTMVSLPGLALALGRYEEAREILLAFAANLNQGLIPNRFPDAGEQPEYNTADATLWFVNAVGEYARRTGDFEFVREKLYEPLRDIIAWHVRGTHYDIRMTGDGLLRAGDVDVQVTWMDVKIAYYVVTPRTGKPVEIQALWYNALRTIERLAGKFGDEETRNRCRAIADSARASFNGLFWNEEQGCLYDCLGDANEPDDSVRPNQIFAVSLPHPLTTGERARKVVECCERELLTPFGLRSLSPNHPDYHPRYEGDAYARDTAYHQGTVWAWLTGAFVTAYLRVNERSPESLARARGLLANFRAHLREAGVGQISEIFDGDAPHTPRGCVAQAWSVAEILRCELEEVN